MEEIGEQAQVVADLRNGLAGVKSILFDLRGNFEAEHAALIASVKSQEGTLAEAESKLKSLGVSAFNADKAINGDAANKKPGPGVSIQDNTLWSYDPEKALGWAMANRGTNCIVPESLNEKAYLIQLKAGVAPGDNTPGIKAVLAQDMVKALANG